jgi:hypothetical protein
MGVLKRVCEETPRPIQQINPDIPDWLAQIIDRLLAKCPNDRFQKADEVASLLGQHLAHLQQPTVVPLPARVTKPSPGDIAQPVKSPGAHVPTQGQHTGQPASAASDTTDALRAQVVRPGRLLVVAGIVNWIMMFIVAVTPFVMPATLGGKQLDFFGSGQAPLTPISTAILVAVVILFLGSGVIIFGAIKMMQLESYRWAMASTVFAMLIGPGYIVGWPAGIWALAVLTRPEIRRLFITHAEARSSRGSQPAEDRSNRPIAGYGDHFLQTVVIGAAVVLCVLASWFVVRLRPARVANQQSNHSAPAPGPDRQDAVHDGWQGAPLTAVSPIGGDGESISWGNASPNGVQLGLELDPYKPEYANGDVVKVRTYLRNVGVTDLITTLPRLEVLEKFDFGLILQDEHGRALSWKWGKAHKARELFTVSGGLQLRLRPGMKHELPAAEVVVGPGNSPDTAMAQLDVGPSQLCQLAVKLGTYGYARGEGEPLESGRISFRISPNGSPQKDAREATTEELDRLVELAEQDLSRMQKLGERNAVPASEVGEAEIKVIEARIRRAQARQEPSVVVSELRRLVELRDADRTRVESLLKSKAVPTSELAEKERQWIDAKLRLKEAEMSIR